MKHLKLGILTIYTLFLLVSCNKESHKATTFNSDNMMVRLSEIEIEPNYLDEYITILKEESEASVRLEPGVISIYPMFQKENPTQIRILEIYASKYAYEAHLQTEHFKEYKTTTLKMVKALKLIDMEAIDERTMPQIFKKLVH